MLPKKKKRRKKLEKRGNMKRKMLLKSVAISDRTWMGIEKETKARWNEYEQQYTNHSRERVFEYECHRRSRCRSDIPLFIEIVKNYSMKGRIIHINIQLNLASLLSFWCQYNMLCCSAINLSRSQWCSCENLAGNLKLLQELKNLRRIF